MAAGLLLQHLAPAVALLLIAASLTVAALYVATHGELRQARWPGDKG